MLIKHLSCVIDIFSPEDPVVQGHSCVVIDELQDLQVGHLCSLQDCSAFCLVEIGWDCDHCVFDWLL